MKNYRNLVVWQKAHKLVLDVYKYSKPFPKDELYGMTSQIRRASVSIAANIVEGCGKFTQRDFAKYLQNSLGSVQEVEYLSLLSHELDYLKKDHHKIIDEQTNEVKAMLIALIKKIRRDL